MTESELVRKDRLQQITLEGDTTDEVEDGGIYRKKRHQCALVHKPPQDQPCANCPNPCDRSESEGMILWMAARMDLEALLAFMWTKTVHNPETYPAQKAKIYEIALDWLDETYAGPPPRLPCEFLDPKEGKYYKMVRSYNEKQEQEPDGPIEHVQHIIRDHFGREVSEDDLEELIGDSPLTEVNNISQEVR